MRIEDVRTVPGLSGFFFDDQQAIKDGATQTGFAYDGQPVTDGFDRIREAGEALIVEIELADGSIATGDCAAVQYSGAGGRDPLFRAEKYRPVVEGAVADALRGQDATQFGANATMLEEMSPQRSGGDQLHTAVRYGVSQALLNAAAQARGVTPTDVLADTYDTEPATSPVPVFGQSGDERRINAEKMLIKGVPVLPHGLFNSVEKVGENGEGLRDYLAWLSDRATALGPEPYSPRFHVDVYGILGKVFGPPYDRTEVTDYFETLREAAAPYPLQVEGPMDAGGRQAQITEMAELREGLADAGVDVDIVADEWCNTFEDVQAFVDAEAADLVQIKTPDLGGIQRSAEAVLYCDGTDTRAYVGGTCNETVTSARACAHVALATDAAQVLAKPGMGFDEGFMVVTNEMRRALARRDATQEVPADD
ncbi:methylaspartate ammonia-lyase [Haloarcula sp. JP-Z28]|uniref:Methylaspartate ammonia-lyase n=2 Tax=Haloarcula marismortui (strain ATCC 43049 / DSM 3752 / JCM 8966 / VKM B-1809) TaxID=272569 RepID=MAAL_HALMA|nr:RecName: Full=Methylaspartate ammonia-lyase; Short=MAL; AltName: Full=3-methylaspartate ammonia-lyase; AltName: Full=Beta-methylaspartase [Haloarcula marismortui ATCC 43049]NHN62810.1 methylaspartate ammonia-lyase [Haloarcula sp. JP-Z28]QCP93270.1 methylaspartate ammonia-lyase [Haloarcula marismortui ATCC 43049]